MLKELKGALSRQKRVIGLIIAGLTALISMIAAAATAVVALTQEVQTAHYVNNLSRNVTMALGTQESIDNKLEKKLDALYSLVMYLGDEVQGPKVRSHLECHAQFQWICVTSKVYNRSNQGWDRVKAHLQGVWHHANISLDLIQLHREILNLKNAPELSFDAAKEASDLLQQLAAFSPSWSPLGHLIISLLALALCVLIGVCLVPTMVKCMMKALLDVRADVHKLRLQTRAQVPRT